jgi:hypothetical protein
VSNVYCEAGQRDHGRIRLRAVKQHGKDGDDVSEVDWDDDEKEDVG